MQQELFNEVKNQLNITWSDDDTDNKVQSIIKRAQAKMNSYAGTELTISPEEDSKNLTSDFQLFLDCCRYIYNDCLEDFEVNFKNDLINLRIRYQIKVMEEAESNGNV